MDKALAHYQQQFTNLRRHKGKIGAAPHKPVLLLAVIDLAAKGHLQANLLQFNDLLENTYKFWWHRLVDEAQPSRIEYPFFHLGTSEYWHLIKDGRPVTEPDFARSRSRAQLRLLDGVRLSDDLWRLLQDQESRDVLRSELLRTYFSTSAAGDSA